MSVGFARTRPPAEPLQEGRDYYREDDRVVFTAHYLRGRGFCCFQGCRHCPWGQAGRPKPAVFADLQRRLDALETRLAAEGLEIEVRNYRNGVLTVLPPPALCLTDRPALEARIRTLAEHLLTVAGIAWE